MSQHSEMLAISTCCCSGSVVVLRLFFSDRQVVVFSEDFFAYGCMAAD